MIEDNNDSLSLNLDDIPFKQKE